MRGKPTLWEYRRCPDGGWTLVPEGKEDLVRNYINMGHKYELRPVQPKGKNV